MKKHTILTVLGIILFSIGYIAAFAFNLIAVWTDLEGMSFWGYPEVTSYDRTIEGDVKVGFLNCPVMITSLDQGTATYALKNQRDFVTKPVVQLHTSQPLEFDGIVRESLQITFLPKEHKTFTTSFNKENKLPNNKIFIRIFLRQGLGQPPYATKHCGIIFFENGTFTGKQIAVILISLSTFIMLLGVILHLVDRRKCLNSDNKILLVLTSMGLLVLLSFILNAAGSWLLSSLILLLSFLAILSILESRLLRPINSARGLLDE